MGYSMSVRPYFPSKLERQKTPKTDRNSAKTVPTRGFSAKKTVAPKTVKNTEQSDKELLTTKGSFFRLSKSKKVPVALHAAFMNCKNGACVTAIFFKLFRKNMQTNAAAIIDSTNKICSDDMFCGTLCIMELATTLIMDANTASTVPYILPITCTSVQCSFEHINATNAGICIKSLECFFTLRTAQKPLPRRSMYDF
jgi:hypothetical protein